MSALRKSLSDIKSATWKSLQRKRWNPSGTTRPAFLVGCGRSGTSMIVLQLGKSWQVEVFNENHPAAFVDWHIRDIPAIEQVIEDSSAPLAVFKPILETYRTRQFLSAFPDARALFAYRHFDDVVKSSLKKFGPDDRIDHINSWVHDDFSEFEEFLPPVASQEVVRFLWKPGLSPASGAALFWLFQNSLYFDLRLAGDSRAKLIGYESIVLNPADILTSSCDFLNINYEDIMAEGIFSSSVRHEKQESVDLDIRQACDEMWLRLCQQADLEATSK